MSQEKYRLQTLMSVRERTRDAAANAVSQKRQALAAAEIELENRKHAVAACLQQQKNANERMLTKMNGGAEAREVLGYRTHLADLRDREGFLRVETTAQEEIVRNAQIELEKALQALKLAAKELKIIEIHRENWREARRRAFIKKEQKLNDEIGTILYQKK